MIGKIIKKMREQNNISLDHLTKLLGIDIKTLLEYENNEKQPSFETLEKIAEYCNYKITFVNKEKNINISKENFK